MEYYSLTDGGRQAIQVLSRTAEMEHSNILKFIDLAGSATVEQVAYSTQIEKSAVCEILKLFISKKWARINRTKMVQF